MLSFERFLPKASILFTSVTCPTDPFDGIDAGFLNETTYIQGKSQWFSGYFL